MKTRHVLAIGILTTIAVGLLAIGIKITKQKPKVQTKAEYQIILAQQNTPNVHLDMDTPNDSSSSWHCNANTQLYKVLENSTETYRLKTTINNLANDLAPSSQATTFFYEFNITHEQAEQQITTVFYKITYLANSTTTIYTSIICGYMINNTLLEPLPPSIQIKFENLDPTDINDIKYAYDTIYETAYINSIQWSGTLSPSNIEQQNIYQTGNNDGYDYGYDEGYDYGYDTGYTTGYQTKDDLSDGNFLSIQETMLNVLTMPFTFISQGFNVTLWEGTQYQINIGNFIKSLIAIATILFIIKMFTSGFSVIGNYTSGTGANISQWRKNRSERKLNESKARLNDRTNPNHKTRDSHVTIKKE